MKTNLKSVLLDVDGKTLGGEERVAIVSEKTKNFLLDSNGRKLTTIIKTDEEPTLKQVLIDVLLSEINQNDPKEPVPSEEKSKRYSLFFRINNSKKDEIDFTVKEVGLLEELLWALKPTLIAGQCAALINNESN